MAFGTAFSLLDVSWIHWTLVTHGHFGAVSAIALFIAMALAMALFPAVFAYVLVRTENAGFSAAVIAPFLWTGLEYIRTYVFTGFPWDLVGYSQAGRLTLIQLADITGIYGISFLVVLGNAAIWKALRCWITAEQRAWRMIVVSALVLGLSVAYGHVRLAAFPEDRSGRHFQLGLLQGNIPQDQKWELAARRQTFNTYQRLGSEAVREGAQLLIWPETSLPVFFGGSDPEWKVAGLISKTLGAPMLVGAPAAKEEQGKTVYHNSAFLVDGETILSRYDKMHLVPFGEYMPLTWLLPLGPGIAAREADYSPGRSMAVMSAGGSPLFSVLICYEAIFPDLARMAVQDGARMLVNITNDGWFGRTAAPYQHLAMAGLRSVENRVWLVRCANTGISAAFDPAGRMQGSLPLEQEGVLRVPVPSSPQAGYFYSRFGDVFAWCCLVACLLMAPGGRRVRGETFLEKGPPPAPPSQKL